MLYFCGLMDTVRKPTTARQKHLPAAFLLLAATKLEAKLSNTALQWQPHSSCSSRKLSLCMNADSESIIEACANGAVTFVCNALSANTSFILSL